MNLTPEMFEKMIQKKLRTNQILLYASIIIGLTVAVISRENIIWSIYFIAIGSLGLVNINKCKADRQLFKNNKLEKANGVLLDCFPETKDESKNWIIFLEDFQTKEIREFTVPMKPDVEINRTYEVHYTPKMEVLVKIA